MPGEDLGAVMATMGLRPSGILVLKDEPRQNASWLLQMPDGGHVALRRYHDLATAEDLAYEHAVLLYLSTRGWVVPEPLGDLVEHAGRLHCLTRFVPGQPAEGSPAGRERRGRDLARLHVALRGLGEQLGQRAGWRAQHTALTVHRDIDWDAALDRLAASEPRLAEWASRAADGVRSVLTAAGASDLPVDVVHGDFAEWNVHYQEEQLSGVIDFGLTHLDSRPYELAIARTYRAPEMIAGYCEELARSDWPLDELELSLIEPLHHAFRLDMVAWQLDAGERSGSYDGVAIERQLLRSGTPAPPT